MKFIILNDTKKFHSGCAAVMKGIRRDLEDNGHEILQSVPGLQKEPEIDRKLYSKADALLVNGEGTMHHNWGNSMYFLLSMLEEAQMDEKKTFLINTVWQDMTNDYDHMLKKLDYLGVREVFSQKELKEKHDINSNIHLDLSYHAFVVKERYGIFDLVSGQFYGREPYRPKNARVINIFEMSWSRIVNLLSTTKILVTGSHHEMYAACRARCPFIVLKGNSHKNEGLMATAEVKCEVLPMGASDESIGDSIFNINYTEYRKLFDWMEEQKPFSIGNVI